MAMRPVLWAELAVKVALVALLVFAVARQDLPQFDGKGMTARAVAYPVVALLVPAVWAVPRGGGRGGGAGQPPPHPFPFHLPPPPSPTPPPPQNPPKPFTTPSRGGTT